MTDMTHISVRIPRQMRDDLDDMARQHRRTTGEEIRLADMVRAAMAEYIKRHKA